jgi:hypothetical protein
LCAGRAKRRTRQAEGMSIRVCLEFTLVDFTLTKEWVLFFKKKQVTINYYIEMKTVKSDAETSSA